MTFGIIKSLIEKNLIESYTNEKDFKKTLREFKHNVLNNKNLSKVYSVYDQLSSPQGLSEKDAKEFLDEGIDLLRRLLPTIKLPIHLRESVQNIYKDIDVLVYNSKIDLSERLQSRKNILSTLMLEKIKVKESINIPIKTMVNVANQTLKTYVESLDDASKKELFQLISEDSKVLETKFENLKSQTIGKLQTILENENEFELKTKISETIEKVKLEKFDQINFLKLKNLSESI